MYIFYFISEYYLYIDTESKSIKYKIEFKKHILYLIVSSIILSIINIKYTKIIILYFIIHIILDLLMNGIKKKINNKETHQSIMFYISYQIFHIIIIYVLGELFSGENLNFALNISDTFLKWILLLVIIIKPVNVSFKILFQNYAPIESNNGKDTIDGAGAIIGNLERLLISIFLYYNQFGAIGLVFTAKSVARFNRISNDPSFAEYYLIGSLYSMISVLICYAVILT